MTEIAVRKDDHIRINLEEDVRSGLTNGFEKYMFIHCALPELDLSTIDTSKLVFAKVLQAPLLISSMTGGTAKAKEVNERLARLAAELNIAMGVGSQRVSMGGSKRKTGFNVRKYAPDILLFANIGAVQLNYGYGLDECVKLVDEIGADGLFLHLNPLQEALQPEGDTNFSGLLAKIEVLCARLQSPVVVKEVGWGLSKKVTRSLLQAGVAGIDVAGAGGTSWSQVEMHRITDPVKRRVASKFVNWGIPTAEAIANVGLKMRNKLLVASGGISDGIEVAKALALGADLCGLAGPFLRTAAESESALQQFAAEIIQTLKVAMFATGSSDLAALKRGKLEKIG